MNHSYATYPGVQNVLSATYTLTAGITPSVVQMEIIPQTQQIAAVGDVVFVHGNTTLTIPGCRADQASMVRGSNGTLVSFSLVDRRWKWKFGEIYGHYNQRDADGLIINATEKTPQQLATLCLQAMGETADVSQIPNNAREEVQWIGENPAEALANILEPFGMLVVLRMDSSVGIVKQGVGAALPSDASLIEQQVASNPPEVPATIRILGAPVRYQAQLKLEAVGYEENGTLKPIEQLSYVPPGGWGNTTMFFTGSSNPKLAMRDVFRLYRIADMTSMIPRNIVTIPDSPTDVVAPIPIGNIGGGGQVGGGQQQFQPAAGGQYTVQYRREILPLLQGLVETRLDQNGPKKRKPERVLGSYWVGNIAIANPLNSGTNYDPYTGQFTIDYDLGLVRFNDQVTRWNDAQKQFLAAELYLECSFSVRQQTTGADLRWSYTKTTNAPNGYGVEIVRREEIQWEKWLKRMPNLAEEWQIKNAKVDLDIISEYYAAGRLSQYVTGEGSSGRYVGMKAISPDGAITQVSWEITASGCYTSASRQYEPAPYVPPHKERRINDMLRGQRRAMLGQQKGRE